MRGLLIFLLGLFFLLTPTHATPVPKERDKYFSVIIGTRWVYDWHRPAGDGPPARDITEVIVDVEHKGDTAFVIFGQTGDDGTIGCSYVMAVSDEGVHYGVNNMWSGPERTRHYTFYNWELKSPSSVGGTWESDINLGDSTRKTKYTNCGYERVKVPAGEYETVKVTSEYVSKDGTAQRQTTWYAKGVGKVKWMDDSGREMVLKSFTLGR